MYLVAVLKCSKRKLIIPIQWLYGFNVTATFNFGFNHNVDHLIFYSPNEFANPPFGSEKKVLENLRNDFHEDEDGCYYARILRGFGTFVICEISIS